MALTSRRVSGIARTTWGGFCGIILLCIAVRRPLLHCSWRHAGRLVATSILRLRRAPWWRTPIPALDATYQFAGFGYVIDYPAGWETAVL